jgi:hypothetical protein
MWFLDQGWQATDQLPAGHWAAASLVWPSSVVLHD